MSTDGLVGGQAGTGEMLAELASERSFSAGLDYGFELDETDRVAHGEMRLSDHVMTPSGRWARASALLTVADMAVGGSLLYVTDPAVPLTVDMALHQVAPPASATLELEATLSKVGRTVSCGEVVFRDAEAGHVVAVATLVFAATPNPNTYTNGTSRTGGAPGTMDRDFLEWCDVRTPSIGVAEVDRAPGRGNSLGSLQGGLVVLLGEVATETLSGREVSSIEVRYLHSVHVGPGQGVATQLGPDFYRAEVRDSGNENRLCALVYVRTEEDR